jgi:CPA2 family monovalent cation:H+ antiporter-2
VLSESHFSHKAAANSLPLQDAFSVIFFLSVGMLFNPAILIREPLAVLAVLALIMIGKGIIAFGIVLALRYPVGTGLMVAASLAQIGEFSFILIGLGATLGLMNDTARDLVLAGAILSIALNPLAIWLSMKLQDRYAGSHYGLKRFASLEADLERIRARGEEREKQRELKIQSLWDTFPFLSLLDKDDQEKLLLQFRPRSASPGDRIIRKGQSGDSMFFIASGAVDVSVAGQSHRLEAGAFFGEIALLTGSRRTADVTAIDFCQLMVLTRRDFNQFMWRYPELRKAVADMAAQRREMNLNFSRQPSMTQPPNLPDATDAPEPPPTTEPPKR